MCRQMAPRAALLDNTTIYQNMIDSLLYVTDIHIGYIAQSFVSSTLGGHAGTIAIFHQCKQVRGL